MSVTICMETDVETVVCAAQAKLDRLLPKGNISFKLLWCIIKPGMIVKYTHMASGEAVSILYTIVAAPCLPSLHAELPHP